VGLDDVSEVFFSVFLNISLNCFWEEKRELFTNGLVLASSAEDLNRPREPICSHTRERVGGLI
jgi:hypothetical protein